HPGRRDYASRDAAGVSLTAKPKLVGFNDVAVNHQFIRGRVFMKATLREHFAQRFIGTGSTDGYFKQDSGAARPQRNHSFKRLGLGALQIEFDQEPASGNIETVESHCRDVPAYDILVRHDPFYYGAGCRASRGLV